MKKDLTELVFILDKSGSMSGLEKDTIGGFNSLIEKQKKELGEAIVSTVLFSDRMDVIHDRISIKDVPKLTSNEYFVSGCTALLDTIGFSINHIKHIQDNMPEEEAAKLGIDKDQAVTYKNDNVGVELNYCVLGDAITGFRKDKKLSKTWRASIDADVKKRGK